MDSFELNKIMGAVLGTLLFVMGAGFVAEALYHPLENRGPGYNLPEPEVTEGGAAAEAEPEVPIATLLASASVERGQAAARKCQSCHNFGEGEPNKQGPHLFDVVGRVEGAVEDFAYSDGMLAHRDAGDTWTYENLNHFLTRPSDYVPGTKMNFAGIRTAEERADILAYLQTLSANPVPFPEPEAAPAEAVAPEGAAEGEPADAQATEADAPAGEAEAPAEEPAETTPPEGDAEGTAVDPEAIEADAPAGEPEAPADAVETPAETQTETPVEGTPTQSNTPAGADAPAATTPPAAPAGAAAPADPGATTP